MPAAPVDKDLPDLEESEAAAPSAVALPSAAVVLGSAVLDRDQIHFEATRTVLLVAAAAVLEKGSVLD